ncbi:HET domain-containing protein [Candidatus Bathyarchaeota archaeon]|nr:HET domain-containing protein [Candidatus Bathyarchaeota archaeon]
MPNRLLDVDVQAPGWDASRVRLVEKQEMGNIEAMPYLTLSHKWGAASMLKLAKSNLDEFKNAGIKLEKLPQRLSDAVSLTRHLNLRYLWVDSLWLVPPHTTENMNMLTKSTR